MKKEKVLRVGSQVIPVQHTSEKGKLNLDDFLRGAIVAVSTPLVAAIGDGLHAWITDGKLDLDPKSLGVIALSAFIAYLGKNLASASQITIKKENLSTAQLKSIS